MIEFEEEVVKEMYPQVYEVYNKYSKAELIVVISALQDKNKETVRLMNLIKDSDFVNKKYYKIKVENYLKNLETLKGLKIDDVVIKQYKEVFNEVLNG